jgi:hypothetical protein
MSKQKVKIKITNTYYFTPEQWMKHDKERQGEPKTKVSPVSEYLEGICLPQETQLEIISPNASNEEGETRMKQGVLFG